MNLVFVDETQAGTDDKTFAVCAVLINSSKYALIVESFKSLLESVGWSPEQEFKGSFIFSGKKGDTAVVVEKRIQLATEVLKLCRSDRNSRVRVSLAYSGGGKSTANFLRLLPFVLKGLPLDKSTSSGKHLVAAYIDKRTGFTLDGVSEVARDALAAKGTLLVEDVCVLDSKPRHLGLALADIIGYICMARHANLGVESFDGVLAFTTREKKQQLLEHWYSMIKNIKLRELPDRVP